MQEAKMKKNLNVFIPIIGIIGAIIMMLHSNNNPIPLLERFLVPLKTTGGRLHYAMLIPVAILYFSLKNILDRKNNNKHLTKTITSLFVLLLIFGLSKFIPYTDQVVRSFSKDLDSMYYHRNTYRLEFQQVEEEMMLEAEIALENLSDQPQAFFLKIKIPRYIESLIIEEELIAIDKVTGEYKRYTIAPKSKAIIKGSFIGSKEGKDRKTSLGQTSGNTRGGDFILFNKEQEVIFIDSLVY